MMFFVLTLKGWYAIKQRNQNQPNQPNQTLYWNMCTCWFVYVIICNIMAWMSDTIWNSVNILHYSHKSLFKKLSVGGFMRYHMTV